MNEIPGLKSAREARGLSRAALAEAAGVATETIWRYENGQRSPQLAEAKKLAAALGVTIDALLRDPQPPQSSPAGEAAVHEQAPVAPVQPEVR